MMMKVEAPIHHTFTGDNLIPETVAQLARSLSVELTIAPEAIAKMNASRKWVETVAQTGKPVVYGVNTGFGSKANVSISREHLQELQYNLIQSHASGTGEPLPIDVVRAAMVLRVQTLVKGYSGIRPVVVERLLEMLERNVVPWIPAQGSVGASGDLAPLSHLALVLIAPSKSTETDYSKAYWWNPQQEAWELLPGKEALRRAGIEPVQLEAREGLALNNGTQISTALLTLAYVDAEQLVKTADIAMALSLEALRGIRRAFHPAIHELRPHPGQMATAENIRRLIEGSTLVDSLKEQVQDAYSLRCHPQVVGSVRDTLAHVRRVLTVELNSTNDNPIILPDEPDANKAFSGGNFHAQPIAFAADFLAIAMAEVGSIAERRIFRMSDKNLNNGLPSFLIANGGLENGLMIAQYTAAALASENKSLAHPASVDSIPTCENQEDHVSMAPIAARKARQIVENVTKIVAIELLYAAQAVDLRARETGQSPQELLGAGTRVAYETIRREVPILETDRPLYGDIDTIARMIRSGALLQAVEQAIGTLR